MDVYLAELQKAEVSPSDAFFCELVRTEQLCHTVDEQLLLSDGHRSASARDPVTIRTAQDFQSRIAGWNSCNLNHLQQGESRLFPVEIVVGDYRTNTIDSSRRFREVRGISLCP